jgi:hypothetical protein
VLQSSERRILGQLNDSDLVLDIGGWAKPFPRADWVLDLMPYETRSPYPESGSRTAERFSVDTWVRRDICDREPYPFEDGQFDFVVCAQTLEDVRDPIWACSEMRRIGKAGYIEVPSRLIEQSYGVQGPWVGYSHHRWLIDVVGDDITFVFKPHILHRRTRTHFPFGFHEQLSADERDQQLWWEGSYSFSERLFYEPEELDRYLEELVVEGSRGRRIPSRWRGRANLLADRARTTLTRRARPARS